MHRFCVAAAMSLLVIWSSSVAADEETASTLMPAAITTAATAAQRVNLESTMNVAERPPRRPIVLPGLYAGFITLQALDTSYTLRSLPLGAREVNPLMLLDATRLRQRERLQVRLAGRTRRRLARTIG